MNDFLGLITPNFQVQGYFSIPYELSPDCSTSGLPIMNIKYSFRRKAIIQYVIYTYGSNI